MSTALALTFAYLSTNLAILLWLEHERARGSVVPDSVNRVVWLLRYGPPLAGAIYLVVISGDWQFVLLVLGFFALSAWLLNGLLAYSNHGPDRRDRTRPDR